MIGWNMLFQAPSSVCLEQALSKQAALQAQWPRQSHLGRTLPGGVNPIFCFLSSKLLQSICLHYYFPLFLKVILFCLFIRAAKVSEHTIFCVYTFE